MLIGQMRSKCLDMYDDLGLRLWVGGLQFGGLHSSRLQTAGRQNVGQ